SQSVARDGEHVIGALEGLVSVHFDVIDQTGIQRKRDALVRPEGGAFGDFRADAVIYGHVDVIHRAVALERDDVRAAHRRAEREVIDVILAVEAVADEAAIGDGAAGHGNHRGAVHVAVRLDFHRVRRRQAAIIIATVAAGAWITRDTRAGEGGRAAAAEAIGLDGRLAAAADVVAGERRRAFEAEAAFLGGLVDRPGRGVAVDLQDDRVFHLVLQHQSRGLFRDGEGERLGVAAAAAGVGDRFGHGPGTDHVDGIAVAAAAA